jgi:subtilase family serine protease
MDYDPAVHYFFTVTNQGAGAAGPFTVNVPGEGSFPIAGLAPGASATRTFRTACKVATEQAIADALAQVPETDETNNARSFTETICLQ